MMSHHRPTSLEEVARRHDEKRQDWKMGLAEFLDEFYMAKTTDRAKMIGEQPPLVDKIADAYLAATAEHLAIHYDLKEPAWCCEKTRFLHRAHFGSDLQSLKAILLVESPIAFRRRMIFVDKSPLERASKYSSLHSNDALSP